MNNYDVYLNKDTPDAVIIKADTFYISPQGELILENETLPKELHERKTITPVAVFAAGLWSHIIKETA